jgi:hypothetical protein
MDARDSLAAAFAAAREVKLKICIPNCARSHQSIKIPGLDLGQGRRTPPLVASSYTI